MCGILRTKEQEKRKTASQLRNQIEHGLTCVLDGCGKSLSTYTGPNSNKLCETHQFEQREYGGLGRVDRPWTFAREWTCTWCSYNPKEDPWFAEQHWDSEEHMNRAMRAMLVGDHKVRKTDGGADTKDNVQTLCQNCNSKKSTLNHDHRRTKLA